MSNEVRTFSRETLVFMYENYYFLQFLRNQGKMNSLRRLNGYNDHFSFKVSQIKELCKLTGNTTDSLIWNPNAPTIVRRDCTCPVVHLEMPMWVIPEEIALKIGELMKKSVLNELKILHNDEISKEVEKLVQAKVQKVYNEELPSVKRFMYGKDIWN